MLELSFLLLLLEKWDLTLLILSFQGTVQVIWVAQLTWIQGPDRCLYHRWCPKRYQRFSNNECKYQMHEIISFGCFLMLWSFASDKSYCHFSLAVVIDVNVEENRILISLRHSRLPKAHEHLHLVSVLHFRDHFLLL